MDVGICSTCGDECNPSSQNCGSCNRKLTGFCLGWNASPSKRHLEDQDQNEAQDQEAQDQNEAQDQVESTSKRYRNDIVESIQSAQSSQSAQLYPTPSKEEQLEEFLTIIGKMKHNELLAKLVYQTDMTDAEKRGQYLLARLEYKNIEKRFENFLAL